MAARRSVAPDIVRENVRNKAKKRLKSRFFQKKRENVIVITCIVGLYRPRPRPICLKTTLSHILLSFRPTQYYGH